MVSRKSIEERLALLEHRMALTEAKKDDPEGNPSNPTEKVLSKLGIVYLL